MNSVASRSMLIFGTDEAVEPLRRLAAGQLSVELDRGNLRYVRCGDREVIRAIAFIIRDTNWGTYAPAISDLSVAEGADGFAVNYDAFCRGADGDFRYHAEITGRRDGTISFRSSGLSEAGFATNRAGFVVLHPLKGVVGQPVAVEHASGGAAQAFFPELVSPTQPIFDIRGLRHEPEPGVAVRVRMEGDSFEMEDHRNWTDASFKTYVRPLARGFPYRIEANEPVEQSVTLTVEGPLPVARADVTGAVTVTLRGTAGLVPRIGLFVESGDIAAAGPVANRVAALKPAFLTGRVVLGGGSPAADLDRLFDLAAAIGCPLALHAVIPGIAPATELAPLAAEIARRNTELDSIFVIPARDLKGRPANTTPPGEATAEDVLAAARKAFPGRRLGGGMPIPFTEMNRNRPPAGIDFVTHATHATEHAADDLSVMETLQSLAGVIRTGRSFTGGVPYRIGPATIGPPASACAGRPVANPANGRVALAENDPRHKALFGAAFALGYIAAVAGEGIEAVTLAAPAGVFGLFGPDGQPHPLVAVIEEVAGLADRRRLGVGVKGPGNVDGIAAEGVDGLRLLLVNLGPARAQVDLPAGRFTALRLIDANALAAHSVDRIGYRPLAGTALELDAYAVAIVK